MGHIRLGTLSASKKWRDVVALLEDGASLESIARSAVEASKRDLSSASTDPLFQFVSRILVELPLMARSPDYVQYLNGLGISERDAATATGLLAGIAGAVDATGRKTPTKSDIGGMAKEALLESLSNQMSDRLPSLFEPTAQEVRRAVASFASGQSFAALARDFFARQTYRSLDYYLSRELANHTGSGKRFTNDAARVSFQAALAQHTFEASKIVESYASGWYGKTIWRDSNLNQEAINRFTSYSFKKMRSELAKREAS